MMAPRCVACGYDSRRRPARQASPSLWPTFANRSKISIQPEFGDASDGREERDDRAADPQGLPGRGRGFLRAAVLRPPRGHAGALFDRSARRRLGAPEHPLPDRVPGGHQRPRLHPDDPREPLRALLRAQPDRQRAAGHARPDLLAPVRGRLPPRLAGQRRPGQHLPSQARRRRPQAGRPSDHREPVHAVGQARSRSSAPAPPASRRRTTCPCSATTSPSSSRRRSRAACCTTASPSSACRATCSRSRSGTRCGSGSTCGPASRSARARTTSGCPACSRSTTPCCSRPAAWRRSACRCAASTTPRTTRCAGSRTPSTASIS